MKTRKIASGQILVATIRSWTYPIIIMKYLIAIGIFAITVTQLIFMIKSQTFILRKPKMVDYSFILTEGGSTPNENPIIYTKARQASDLQVVEVNTLYLSNNTFIFTNTTPIRSVKVFISITGVQLFSMYDQLEYFFDINPTHNVYNVS